MLSIPVFSYSQKLPNPKIGKNEIEISSCVFNDNSNILGFGGQFIYRLTLDKRLKIGAGSLYAADLVNYVNEKNAFGYGAAFADLIQFIGQRQKWSLEGQFGHGFHSRDYGDGFKIKPGIYYSISAKLPGNSFKEISNHHFSRHGASLFSI